MKATEDLRHEHRAVERMLAILDRMGTRALGETDIVALDEIVDFLHVFVDACHHHKEEQLLFPALIGEGRMGADKLVTPLLHEHERGRELVVIVSTQLEMARAGKAASFGAIAQALSHYVSLLRAHIAEEEGGAFALADAELPDAVQQSLAEGYDEVERVVVGEGRHEAFHAMLDRLEAQ